MVFVDPGAWVALTEKSDSLHEEARAIYARLKQQRVRFLTTDYVVDETVTRLRYGSGHESAVRFIDAMEQAVQAGVVHLVAVDAALFREALALFRQYDSVVLSLTDCTSFAVCRKYQTSEAFAYDQHYAMRGIALCPSVP